MFGRKETREKISWDEWSGADSWSASNVESIESAKNPFSFFSFNLFESEEKFQVGSSNSDGSDDDDDNMEEKAPNRFFDLAWPREKAQENDRKHEKESPNQLAKNGREVNDAKPNFNNGLAEKEPAQKGRFWRHGRKHNISQQQNQPGSSSNSADFTSPKRLSNQPKPSQSTLRSYAKPKDLIQKHLRRAKNYDFRDENEANSSRGSGQQRREPAVHPFPSGNQTFEDRDGTSTSKKCFPSWPFKNRVSTDEEFIVTEPELKPVLPVAIEEVRAPVSLNYDGPPTTASLAAKINSTRKKAHSQLSNPSLFGVTVDDIWDDGTTSSGWLTLESLDGR